MINATCFNRITFLCLLTLAESTFCEPHLDQINHSKQRERFLAKELQDWQNPENSYNRAVADYSLQKWKAAEQGFRSSANSSTGKLQEKSWFNAGNAASKLKKWPQAIEAYEKALEIDRENKR